MFDVCSEAYVSLSVIAGTEGIFDNNEWKPADGYASVNNLSGPAH